MPHAERISPERHVLAFVAVALAAPLAATLCTALRAPVGAAVAVAALLAVLAYARVAGRLPQVWDGLLRTRPLLCIAWFLMAIAAIVREYGVALFIMDAEQAEASALWFDGFYIRHSCLSAYWKAAELARAGTENLYDFAHYEGSELRFKLDEFLYPPQFLILPLAIMALGAGFLELRSAWFAFEAGMLLAGMLAACCWIGGAAGRRAALLIPAVILATPVVLTLQLGNFQIAAIAMSVLAMILFERGRAVTGGALLGFALFKIFPLLLGVYLLINRRWAALAWTTAFCAAYTLVAWLWIGTPPFAAFLHYELPRITGGGAWAWLGNEGMEAVVAINASVTGAWLKLRQFGIDADGLESVLSWTWTLGVAALTVLVAWRAPRLTRHERVACWIALLGLAALRSPFVPDAYALFPAVWLWSLVAAAAPTRRNAIVALALLWFVLAAVLPFSGMPLPDVGLRLMLSTTSQLAAIALSLWTILRSNGRLREAEAVDAGLAQPRHVPA